MTRTGLEPLAIIGAGLAAREQVLRQSGLDVAYLRPNSLMSNALWWIPAIRAEARLPAHRRSVAIVWLVRPAAGWDALLERRLAWYSRRPCSARARR